MTSQKKLNQLTMIQIVSKNTSSLINYKELICFQRTKRAGTKISKKECYMNGKKFWKSLFGEKHFLGKPIHFTIKNTLNNVDTWGFILQFFQHLYRIANSIVTLRVWVKTAQILWYRQQHISLKRIQLSRVVLIDTSWSKSRQHKFTDIGNNIFLQESSSIAAKFFEGFIP